MTQPPRLRYSYLGPPGTFSEDALRQVVAPKDAEYLHQVDVVSAIEAVRTGDADFAVVAIENSVEGGVTAVLDTLAVGSPLVIIREMLVPVSFILASLSPEMTMPDITSVAAHPHAWAQCRHWAHKNLPGVNHVPASSNTSAAAAMAAAREEFRIADETGVATAVAKHLGYQAALVPPRAIEHYGLTALHTGVADNPDAVTRFVLVGKPHRIPRRTGADKTTLWVSLPEERAGALLDMLEQFATRGINLSRIESRPSGDLGHYSFSIDAEGHLDDSRMAEALVGLHRYSPQVRYLGSYPRADAVEPRIPKNTTDQAYLEAQAWLAAVRAGHAV